MFWSWALLIQDSHLRYHMKIFWNNPEKRWEEEYHQIVQVFKNKQAQSTAKMELSLMQNHLQTNWSNGSRMLFCRYTQQIKLVFGTAYFHTWPWSITAMINHWKMRGCFKLTFFSSTMMGFLAGQESHLRPASHCSSSLVFCWNERSFSSDNCSKKHAAACKMGS